MEMRVREIDRQTERQTDRQTEFKISTFENSYGCTALGMPECREITWQKDW